MHVLNIESNYSFLDSLYQFLIEKFNNYINISEVTVFLPSRRSVNELKHIFLKNSKQQAKILPTIKSIGDIDYDDILLNCSNLNLISNYTDIFKPISNTKYKILLLREMLNSKKNISIDQAINLSKEFEIFLRNMEENKINLVDLSKVIDDNNEIYVVPILRAGLAISNNVCNFLPFFKVQHLGMYRNEKTLEPVWYYNKLPETFKKPKNTYVYICDPMLATGGSIIEAIKLYISKGVPESNITLLNIISAPEGINKVKNLYANINMYTTAIDEKLNDIGYIVPGLGDAGDRFFNTLY